MTEKIITFEEWFKGSVFAPEARLCCAVAWRASGVEHEKEIDLLKTRAENHERAKLYTQEENRELHEENKRLKAQLKEMDEQIKKLQSIIDDVDDAYCFTTYCSDMRREFDETIKQKDAEIEKKDYLLREAVEVIKYMNIVTNHKYTNDFLKKMEQK